MNAVWGGSNNGAEAAHGDADHDHHHHHHHHQPPVYDYEQQGAQWFTTYFRFCERNGRRIFFFWCIIFLLSLFYGPRFLTMGDDRVSAPEGTDARVAELEFEARFQEKATEVPMLIFVRVKDAFQSELDISDPRLFAFSEALTLAVLTYNDTHENVRSIISYYAFSHTLLDSAKSSFVNKDKSATFMNIMVSGEQITHERYEFVQFMEDQIDVLNPSKHEFFIGLTGIDAMMYDTSTGAAKNVMRTDAFSVPIGMVLLGLMIHSWRLLIFSFFNMGLAILASFAAMAFAVNHLGLPNPESASSQLMEVITLAISIDWSLFLHRRYRDEIKRGADHRKAAYMSLMHSGHVVIMSGVTLWVVFVAFFFLPAATVQMDGTCCSMGVFVALVVALTNTPAVWLGFPEFCSDFDNRCCKNKTIEELNAEATRLGLNDTAETPLLMEDGATRIAEEASLASSAASSSSSDSMERPTVHVMYSGPRFRFTRWVTRYPNNILAICLVYILVIPFALQVQDIVLNQDILASMPRGSASAQTFKQAFDNFPGGTFSPFYAIVTSKSREDRDVVLNRGFFDAARTTSSAIYKASKKWDTGFTSQSVISPVYLSGFPISLAQSKEFLLDAKSHDCNVKEVAHKHRKKCEMGKSYEFAWKQSVNAQGNAMLITITVPFFPFASKSADYIDVVNQVLDEARAKHPQYDFYLSGVVVGFDALQRRVIALFPRMIITTFAIVFVLLGILLRSLFVPVRLALTLVAPICAVFGSAVLVYQKGALEWMDWAPLGRMDGFYWYIPILMLSMIIGLSLDWDVLLVSRIMEHRENGYDIQAAICKATCETGGTISVAGIIMCLAFGSMLLSDQMLINACGFILTVALVLDTFVVNTTLVPALISIGDRVAWYPVRMPMDKLKTLDNCNEFPQD